MTSLTSCVVLLAASMLFAGCPPERSASATEPASNRGSAGATDFSTRIEAAERALLEQVAFWNAGDLDAFCALYVEDALFVSPSGITEGRDQVLARYRQRYPDRAAMGTLDIEVRERRAESGGEIVALAGTWTLRYPDREAATGQTLVVMKATGDDYRIALDASM